MKQRCMKHMYEVCKRGARRASRGTLGGCAHKYTSKQASRLTKEDQTIVCLSQEGGETCFTENPEWVSPEAKRVSAGVGSVRCEARVRGRSQCTDSGPC